MAFIRFWLSVSLPYNELHFDPLLLFTWKGEGRLMTSLVKVALRLLKGLGLETRLLPGAGANPQATMATLAFPKLS